MKSLIELSNLINKIYFFTYASMKNRKGKKNHVKKVKIFLEILR